jgi:hypothetical protein
MPASPLACRIPHIPVKLLVQEASSSSTSTLALLQAALKAAWAPALDWLLLLGVRRHGLGAYFDILEDPAFAALRKATQSVLHSCSEILCPPAAFAALRKATQSVLHSGSEILCPPAASYPATGSGGATSAHEVASGSAAACAVSPAVASAATPRLTTGEQREAVLPGSLASTGVGAEPHGPGSAHGQQCKDVAQTKAEAMASVLCCRVEVLVDCIGSEAASSSQQGLVPRGVLRPRPPPNRMMRRPQ